MSGTADRYAGGPTAAWARWSDPRVSLRLAAERTGSAREACDLDGWVQWVAIEDEEIADLDGVHLTARDELGAARATRFPELPLLDERSPTWRADRPAFLVAIFTRNRWRARSRVIRPLAEFHETHELLLRCRGEEGAAELAEIASAPAPSDAAYGPKLLRHLARPTSRDEILRILLVALARVRTRLAPRDRRALRLAIEDFGRGTLPLVAPRTLLRHHAASCGEERLANQLFLDPYPAELEHPRRERADGPA